MAIILNKEQLETTIKRLAFQIAENYSDGSQLCVLGIQPRGIFLSERIVEILRNTYPALSLNHGTLDITFYRDDFREEFHRANRTDISFSLENKAVIIIDDVLYTGRTIRASLDALLSFGRPSKVELCVLIDRKFSREFPIQPDYFGKAIDSIISQKVSIDWKEETVNIE